LAQPVYVIQPTLQDIRRQVEQMELRPNISAVRAISSSRLAANCLSQLTARASVQWRIFLSPQLPIHKRLCYGRGTARRRNSATKKHPSPWLSCGIICVILRLAVFTQYRSVTDTHTQTDRRTDKYSIASRGKNRPYCTAHQV